ncbi:MAG: gliding motility-associated C-terminal domain-containing protein [Saprospiraceae bacterium]|nr:gliding motility-associated C-terminal domain-containing protein [Saprospiraceae bacterium]
MNNITIYKHVLLLFFCCVNTVVAFAQCPTANQPAAPGTTCSNAPVFCGDVFDNYCSVTSATPNVQVISSFTGTIDNVQFVGFIPTASSVSIQIDFSNCANNDGLQGGVFQTPNCIGYSSVSNVFNPGGQGMFDSGSFILNTNITVNPGEVYYLIIDGFNGDVCEWEVTVLDGISPSPDLAAPTSITGPNMLNGTARVCQNQQDALFVVSPVVGAASYLWTLPVGATMTPLNTRADSILVSFGAIGGQVCAQARSYCDTSLIACVSVATIPPLNTSIRDTICLGSVYDFNGTSLFTSGTYKDTLQASTGCDSIVTLDLRVQNPAVSSLNRTICDGDSFTVGDSIYSEPGFYTTLLQSVAGCDSIVNLTLQVVRAEILPSNSLACGDTIILDAGLSTGANSFVWTTSTGHIVSGSNTSMLHIDQPGMYHLSVSNGMCTDTASIAVTNSGAAGNAILMGGEVDCLQDSLMLDFIIVLVDTITIYDPNGDVVYGFNWNTGISTGSPYAHQPGIFTIIGTDGNGCTVSDTTLITSSGVLPDAAAIGATLTCGAANAQLHGNSTTNDVTYSWIGPLGETYNSQNPIVTNIGQYILTVHLGSCTAQDTASVVADISAPTTTATGGSLTCVIDSVQLVGITSAVGATFAWAGPDPDFNTTIANPFVDVAGVYTLTISLGNCTNTDTAVVTASTALSVAASASDITCADTLTHLQANSNLNNASFSWTGPLGFTAVTADTDNTVAGQYIVIATLGSCTSSDTVVALLDTILPNVAASGGVLTCGSNGVQLTGNSTTFNVTYRWTTPSGSIIQQQNPIVTETGTYTLRVNVDFCYATDTAVVMPDATLPNVSANGGVIACGQDSIQLFGNSSTSGAVLSWTGPDPNFITTTNNPFVHTAGVYTLTVNANGCTNTDTAVVMSLGAFPSVTASADTINIDCNDPSAQLVVSPASPNNTYRWLLPNGTVLANMPTTTTSNSGAFIAEATTASGCVGRDTVIVLADFQAPQLSASADTLKCVGDSVQIFLNNTTVAQTAIYQWTNINGFSSMLEDPFVQTSGTYNVIATATNGCKDTLAVQVVALPMPQLGINGEDITCTQTSITLSANTTASISDYLWSGNGVNSTQPTISVSQGGTYQLAITTIDGCNVFATILIDKDTIAPIADAGTPTMQVSDCNGNNTFMLDGNASSQGVNFNYNWTTTAGTIISAPNNLSITAAGVGRYYLMVTNNLNGCTAIDSILVIANGNGIQQVAWNIVEPTCFGDADGSIILDTVFGGTPPYIFVVNDTMDALSGTFNYLTAGVYNILITDAAGCESDTTIVLTQPQPFVVDLGEDMQIILGDSAQIFVQTNVTALDTIIWSLPQLLVCDSCLQTFTHTLLNSTQLDIMVRDENGCVAIDNLRILVEKPKNVFIPTAFSPNNDGFNDVFFIQADALAVSVRAFRIFNRWGEMMFVSNNTLPNNQSQGWDGNFRGERLNPAVFVYYAEIEFLDGSVKIFEGDITLLR